jgi:hypothetical protein
MYVRLIFWLTDSTGIFTCLSIESDALYLLRLAYVLVIPQNCIKGIYSDFLILCALVAS